MEKEKWILSKKQNIKKELKQNTNKKEKENNDKKAKCKEKNVKKSKNNKQRRWLKDNKVLRNYYYAEYDK